MAGRAKFFINLLTLSIILFIGFLLLYASYEYLLFFIFSLLSFGIMVYFLEKQFGYPQIQLSELRNKSIPEARKNISFLLNKTSNEIIIVSGSLNHEIYNNPQVLSVFRHLFEQIRSGAIDLKIFITENSIDLNNNDFLKLLVELNVPINRLNLINRNKINHFISVDSMHVRLEENHEPGAADRKAILRFNTPYLSKKVEHYFNDLLKKDNIEKIDVRKILESREV